MYKCIYSNKSQKMELFLEEIWIKFRVFNFYLYKLPVKLCSKKKVFFLEFNSIENDEFVYFHFVRSGLTGAWTCTWRRGRGRCGSPSSRRTSCRSCPGPRTSSPSQPSTVSHTKCVRVLCLYCVLPVFVCVCVLQTLAIILFNTDPYRIEQL